MVVLSSSEEVWPNFGVAQDMEEEGPCNQTQTGTFLEHKKKYDGVLIIKEDSCGYLVTQKRQIKKQNTTMKREKNTGRERETIILCEPHR